jgi:hypothetical protein
MINLLNSTGVFGGGILEIRSRTRMSVNVLDNLKFIKMLALVFILLFKHSWWNIKILTEIPTFHWNYTADKSA